MQYKEEKQCFRLTSYECAARTKEDAWQIRRDFYSDASIKLYKSSIVIMKMPTMIFLR